jgi:hypothetical protein
MTRPSLKLWLPELAEDPLDKYRTQHSAVIDPADFGHGGFTRVRVLPELINCKLDMVVVSLLKALGAVTIRISICELTCDVPSDVRATVIVDKDDIISQISLELPFLAPKAEGLMCGADLMAKIRKLRVSRTRKQIGS